MRWCVVTGGLTWVLGTPGLAKLGSVGDTEIGGRCCFGPKNISIPHLFKRVPCKFVVYMTSSQIVHVISPVSVYCLVLHVSMFDPIYIPYGSVPSLSLRVRLVVLVHQFLKEK